MKRTCPRCDELSPDTFDYCVACGMRLVLHPAQRKPRWRPHRRYARRTQTA